MLCTGFLQLWRAGATPRCGAWAYHRGGLSCCGAPALGVRASAAVARRLQSAGSAVVAHGLSCSTACGILPDQGSNPCLLPWQDMWILFSFDSCQSQSSQVGRRGMIYYGPACFLRVKQFYLDMEGLKGRLKIIT